MITLLLAAAAASRAPHDDQALRLCRPVLERKAEGKIATIEVTRSRVRRASRTIEGQIIAFVGMGAPASESASAHHLIRASFKFKCRVNDSQVLDARLNPLLP